MNVRLITYNYSDTNAVNTVFKKILDSNSDYIGVIHEDLLVDEDLIKSLDPKDADFIEFRVENELGLVCTRDERYNKLFPSRNSGSKPYVPALVLYKTKLLKDSLDRFSHLTYPRLCYNIEFLLQCIVHCINKKLTGLAYNDREDYAIWMTPRSKPHIRSVVTAHRYYAKILKNLGITAKQYVSFLYWCKINERSINNGSN